MEELLGAWPLTAPGPAGERNRRRLEQWELGKSAAGGNCKVPETGKLSAQVKDVFGDESSKLTIS